VCVEKALRRAAHVGVLTLWTRSTSSELNTSGYVSYSRGHVWITIPAGTIIRVIAGPNGEGDRMVDVLWESRPLSMFAIDLTAGGTEIQEQVLAAGVQKGRRLCNIS
jgi:hypothetical protein